MARLRAFLEHERAMLGEECAALREHLRQERERGKAQQAAMSANETEARAELARVLRMEDDIKAHRSAVRDAGTLEEEENDALLIRLRVVEQEASAMRGRCAAMSSTHEQVRPRRLHGARRSAFEQAERRMSCAPPLATWTCIMLDSTAHIHSTYGHIRPLVVLQLYVSIDVRLYLLRT